MHATDWSVPEHVVTRLSDGNQNADIGDAAVVFLLTINLTPKNAAAIPNATRMLEDT